MLRATGRNTEILFEWFCTFFCTSVHYHKIVATVKSVGMQMVQQGVDKTGYYNMVYIQLVMDEVTNLCNEKLYIIVLPN